MRVTRCRASMSKALTVLSPLTLENWRGALLTQARRMQVDWALTKHWRLYLACEGPEGVHY